MTKQHTSEPWTDLLCAAKQVYADFEIQIHGGRAEGYLVHRRALKDAIAAVEAVGHTEKKENAS